MTTVKATPTTTETTKAAINPRVNYVDKAEFLARITEYRKDCRAAKKAKKPKPKIPEYLARCIMLIAENAAKHPHYSRYSFKDIMISDAVENCVRYFDNFDPRHAKKNPFGYFSTCCIYAFWRRIGLEKEELYGKYKLAQQSGVMDELHNGMEDNGSGDGSIQKSEIFDNLNTFIAKYEEGLAKKKEKKALKKAEKKRIAKGLEKFAKKPTKPRNKK